MQGLYFLGHILQRVVETMQVVQTTPFQHMAMHACTVVYQQHHSRNTSQPSM